MQTQKRRMTGLHRIRRSEARRLLAEALRQQGLDITEMIIQVVEDTERRIDIGIVVALKEEFDVIFPNFRAEPCFFEDIPQYFYIFDWPAAGKRTYRCVATLVGGMGPVKAALTTDRLVNRFAPASVVNIGIAGSMDAQLLVGDVVVAEQADDYLYQSKAVNNSTGNGFEFKLSGDPYKTDPPCVEHARHFAYAHWDAHQKWREASREFLKSQVSNLERYNLLRMGVVREDPEIRVGNLASSTTVGAASEFVDWLLGRDRKYVAIEMEAAGILCATFGLGLNTVIIRGISDFSNSGKAEMDGIGHGALRRYAMGNALGVLHAFIERQLLPVSAGDQELLLL